MDTKQIISLLSHVREQANKFIIREMSKQGITGIVPSHGEIIVELLKHDALTMKELATRIDRDKSTVTALVDKLIKLGYAEKTRDANDNRVVFVTLTENGRALKAAFEAISNNLLSTVYQGISKEEQVFLVSILNKIKENL
jgi:DNA-binding MarR family transcriptional regulator